LWRTRIIEAENVEFAAIEWFVTFIAKLYFFDAIRDRPSMTKSPIAVTKLENFFCLVLISMPSNSQAAFPFSYRRNKRMSIAF
jgi:hypothetical protein